MPHTVRESAKKVRRTLTIGILLVLALPIEITARVATGSDMWLYAICLSAVLAVLVLGIAAVTHLRQRVDQQVDAVNTRLDRLETFFDTILDNQKILGKQVGRAISATIELQGAPPPVDLDDDDDDNGHEPPHGGGAIVSYLPGIALFGAITDWTHQQLGHRPRHRHAGSPIAATVTVLTAVAIAVALLLSPGSRTPRAQLAAPTYSTPNPTSATTQVPPVVAPTPRRRRKMATLPAPAEPAEPGTSSPAGGTVIQPIDWTTSLPPATLPASPAPTTSPVTQTPTISTTPTQTATIKPPCVLELSLLGLHLGLCA
jgi:hypothetical protein